MHIPDELKHVLDSNPEIISGAVRFVGTRIPVQALIDSLEYGRSLEYFREGFPDVSEEQVLAFLRWQQNEARKRFGIELGNEDSSRQQRGQAV